MAQFRHFSFSFIDTNSVNPVYHCDIDAYPLWLVHPLARHLYNHSTFSQHFSAAFVSALQFGYHPFDALVLASIYASKCEAEGAGMPFEGFPQIHLAYPKRYYSVHKKPSINSGLCLIGLYPIVNRSDWLVKLAGTGISTIQLRIKDLSGKALEQEIAQATEFAKAYQYNLFINDHWELAIQYGAYGVHLGQEDLAVASVKSIADAGLRLGISTHCHFEVARAHALNPDYLAIGPVFATQTKSMAFPPQGLSTLAYWRQQLTQPLVAIAGINAANINQVIACLDKSRDGIAMISAITQAENPAQVAKKLQGLWESDSKHQASGSRISCARL